MNPLTGAGYNAQMGGIGAGIGGALGMMFGQNPVDAAQPYMDKASGAIDKYYNQSIGYEKPYYQSGIGAMNSYLDQAKQMSDPSAYYNHLMSGFQMSPAQMQQQQLGLEGVSNNAAMHGLMGSGNEAKALNDYSMNNTAQAQQQYLQNLLGIGNQSMTAYGNVMGQGANAANQMGQFGMSAGESQAALQKAMAQAAAGQANAQNQGIGSLLGSVGAIAGFL